jgi:hypothetical protein
MEVVPVRITTKLSARQLRSTSGGHIVVIITLAMKVKLRQAANTATQGPNTIMKCLYCRMHRSLTWAGRHLLMLFVAAVSRVQVTVTGWLYM